MTQTVSNFEEVITQFRQMCMFRRLYLTWRLHIDHKYSWHLAWDIATLRIKCAQPYLMRETRLSGSMKGVWKLS